MSQISHVSARAKEGKLSESAAKGEEFVPIVALRAGDSPRMNGVDEAHAQLLAESDSELPAILVQRCSMRVIDGMHRLRAAQIRRQTRIRVRFFDDDDAAAFVRGVTANIAHGRPLSLEDRKAAASRIMEMNPEWSDRAVARAVGLSNKTVAALRRLQGNVPEPRYRRGQDGRMRPTDATVGRQLAGRLLASRPDASLREIAAAAGVSPTTVRKVRDGMHRGAGTPTPTPPPNRARPARTMDIDVTCERILDNLDRDPSLRYTEAGRTLLRLLHKLPTAGCAEQAIAEVPTHCLPLVARLTRLYARQWEALADLVESRVST